MAERRSPGWSAGCRGKSGPLWDAFAQKERKKVHRDGAISLWGVHDALPKEYAGGHVWVRTFHDKAKVLVGPND